MPAISGQAASRGDGGGNSLTPANPWSATRGTHARGVPTAVCNRLVFATRMRDDSAATTIRIQAEQGRGQSGRTREEHMRWRLDATTVALAGWLRASGPTLVPSWPASLP